MAALKLEIKNLENQFNAYTNEKIELEKTLSTFQRMHANELGDIILEMLRLRKLKYQTNKVKYEEAENDEMQYKEQLVIESKKQIFELSDEEKAELKKKFRQASFLCHPDKVNDEFKEEAQILFINLKEAYDNNDINTVSHILDELIKNNAFKSNYKTTLGKDILRLSIINWQKRIKTIELEIITIKQSETFNTIIAIQDWVVYFSIIKERLKKELDILRNQV